MKFVDDDDDDDDDDEACVAMCPSLRAFSDFARSVTGQAAFCIVCVDHFCT